MSSAKKTACANYFAVLCVAPGAGSEEALREPEALAKAITALEISKIDELTSRKDEQGSSCHLRKAEFLGTVSRDKRIHTIVHAAYVRSSPPAKEAPPRRRSAMAGTFPSICPILSPTAFPTRTGSPERIEKSPDESGRLRV